MPYTRQNSIFHRKMAQKIASQRVSGMSAEAVYKPENRFINDLRRAVWFINGATLPVATQMRKRAVPTQFGASPAKRHKTAKAAEKPKRKDGWIWDDGALFVPSENNEKVAEFKRASEMVEYFRAESEAFRWVEQYERKHVELFRTTERFRYDADVWDDLANQQEGADNRPGSVVYARMQAGMWRRLSKRAEASFKAEHSGAHADWIKAESFDDLVARIMASRDQLFAWMDPLGMERAYKLW
ncbi:hypothetical protein GGX14DRAFT_391467 [Mycena pura]|uniref:Uncharacterized protein n=1 Tax=Mycena pura TaxID=153505 RepID=A0AAD6Y1D5_9AGAR|nr:hypothetical protein GGX14DRAFT_408422 [Mycena pura]KAJ7215786.1 hypothetical protein GGX14DRAFT_391467 [Mycena pura]